MEGARVESYVLLAVVGGTPSVLTELIWALSPSNPQPPHDPPMLPERVIALTTTTGRRHIEALLTVGEPAAGVQGEARERWSTFCQRVVGRLVALEVEVAGEQEGHPLSDIRTPADDERFANCVYDRVFELTWGAVDGEEAAEGEALPPVVGCVAGGRKTMGLHMVTAFSLFGRASDRLYHVLVDDETERDRTFFYPTTEGRHLERPGFRLDAVPVRIPKLRVLLQQGTKEGFLEGLLPRLDRRRYYAHLLQQLDPYQEVERKPERMVVSLARESVPVGQVWLCDGRGVIGAPCDLTPEQLTTLLVVLEHTQQRGEDGYGSVSQDVLENDRVHEQRQYLMWLFARDRPHRGKAGKRDATRIPLARWTRKGISDEINNLKEGKHGGGLYTIPALREHLKLVGKRDTKRNRYVYYFVKELPDAIRIEVVEPKDVMRNWYDRLERWEDYFDVLPRPVLVPYRSVGC